MPDVDARMRKLIWPAYTGAALLLFSLWFLRLLPFSSFLQRLEYAQLDWMFKLRGTIPPSDQICIVAIDDASLQQTGAWPWPRRTLASLLQGVLAAHPAVVIGDFILPRKSDDHEGTAELARAMREFRQQQNRSVLLPYYFGSFTAAADSALPLPEPIAASAFVLFDHPEALRALPIPHALAVYHSDLELLSAGSPGGHINVLPDEMDGDDAARWENHLVGYARAYFPSLPIQAAMHAQRLTRAQVQVKAGASIQVGNQLVPIDAQGRGWINYYGPPGVFPTISAMKVLQGQETDKLRDKIVFIGVTAAGTQDFLQTPVSARMPGVEKLATSTSNILAQDMLLRPRAAGWMELAALLTLILLASFLAKKFRPLQVGLALAGLCFLLVAATFSLFVFARIWLQSAGLLLAVMAATGGLCVLRRFSMAGEPALELDVAAKMPRRLGRFEITGVLGEGAMGKIFAGFDPAINRKVAIKTIRPLPGLSPSGNAKMRQRFLHEARAAGALNHPNIVTIYHADEAGPYSYLVMELLEGKTLEEIIQAEAPLPLGRTLDILLPICDALQYAHQHGVVHRDLKPANVMLTRGGAAKLMDFGVAHIFSSKLTLAGALLGTPSYMSPEQMLGEKVDGRSDIFALGIVAYEMATRTPPFLADTMAAISHRIVSGAFVPPSALNTRVPPAFDEVIQKALQKDKTARYQTAMDFAIALAQLMPSD